MDDGNGHTAAESLQVTANDVPSAEPTNVSKQLTSQAISKHKEGAFTPLFLFSHGPTRTFFSQATCSAKEWNEFCRPEVAQRAWQSIAGQFGRLFICVSLCGSVVKLICYPENAFLPPGLQNGNPLELKKHVEELGAGE